jgi:polar amino acid transport system substrate-binding protein
MTRLLRIATISIVALLAGCGAGPGGVTARTVPEVTVQPSGVQMSASVPKEVLEDCDPRASFRPQAGYGVIPPGSTMAKIRDRGRLVIGIGPSAYLLSFRDPHDQGKVHGFEADIAREIAFALFGDSNENRIHFRALNTADRIPAVRGVTDRGQPVEPVDMVLAAMTMTCERWKLVSFSAEYYSAGQRVLVPRGSGIKGMADLGGKKVCASATSTNLRSIEQAASRPVPVSAPNTSDCLLLLQQGQVAAVSTGDVILAGLAAQDPSMEIAEQGPFSEEPTGIAMAHEAQDLVRFVNAVLERIVQNGTWAKLQEHWLVPMIGAATPPVPRYQAG